MEKKYIQKILNILYKEYPNARCELNYNTAFELLIATVLSAQTTDKKVNEVTSRLFQKYNTPYEIIKLNQETLENQIKEIGLYRNKAKNILALSNSLIVNFNGEVPNNKEELISLAGVGRKTANVVLSNAFNVPAFAVDTHVFRVSNRIGIVNAKDTEETEKQLMKNIPMNQWIIAHHTLIFHGRKTCIARKPKCDFCCIKEYCNSAGIFEVN